MPFDFKKEFKGFYLPKAKPDFIEVPKINYLAMRGKGDPNAEDSEYKQSIGLLYAVAFTLKMSYKGERKIEGFFEYVVPPLEGFWWQDGGGFDYSRKDEMHFISVIRLPDFVSRADFDWAISEATHKKKQNFSRIEFLTIDEGLCVQCMHLGSYDDEPTTLAAMHEFAAANGCKPDIRFQSDSFHQAIFFSALVVVAVGATVGYRKTKERLAEINSNLEELKKFELE